MAYLCEWWVWKPTLRFFGGIETRPTRALRGSQGLQRLAVR
jgi:hypothetical protein